jgi:hypothetical protein
MYRVARKKDTPSVNIDNPIRIGNKYKILAEKWGLKKIILNKKKIIRLIINPHNLLAINDQKKSILGKAIFCKI